MQWNAISASTESKSAVFAPLPHTVGKAGASESVAIVAIIWGIIILA